jgi:hypothetical protein
MPCFGGGLRAIVILTSLALIGAFLTYKLSLAIRFGLADLYAAPAIRYIERTQDRGTAFTAEEWQATQTNLRQALLLAPSNPVYLSNLGYLHQMKLDNEKDTLEIDELARHVELAYEFYESAASVRPTWSYDWGNLAVEKYRMVQYSSEAYSRALSQTARYGPWKDDAQLLVADLGTDTWEFLAPEARMAVLDSVDRALQRQPDEIVAIIDAYEAWEKICQYTASIGSSGALNGTDTGDRSAGRKTDNLARLKRHCVQDSGDF